MTVWPSGLRRWLQAPVRKGVGSNPTAVNCIMCVHTLHVLGMYARCTEHTTYPTSTGGSWARPISPHDMSSIILTQRITPQDMPKRKEYMGTDDMALPSSPSGSPSSLCESSRALMFALTSIVTDSLAEWSKALGVSPQGRGFEPHSCHLVPRGKRRMQCSADLNP